MTEELYQVKVASKQLALLNDDERNAILLDLAESTEAHAADLLAANTLDLARMDKADPRYDRLQLTEGRLRDIAADLRRERNSVPKDESEAAMKSPHTERAASSASMMTPFASKGWQMVGRSLRRSR